MPVITDKLILYAVSSLAQRKYFRVRGGLREGER